MFEVGKFISHSGKPLLWKINCDFLSDEAVEAAALIIANQGVFGEVHGVPTGGNRLAKALQPYCLKDHPVTLIVDDVLTTGGSMETFRRKLGVSAYNATGVVLFARKPHLPNWIKAVFTLDPIFDREFLSWPTPIKP